MTIGIGALGHLGLRKEASFASGGTIDNWQPIDSEDIQLTHEHAYGDRIQASEEQVGGIQVRRAVSGQITFGVSPQNATQWWECGLGGTSSPYSGARPLSSLMLQIDREAGAVQASGCMISSMSFSSSQGGDSGAELKCAVTIEGKDIGACSAGSPTFTSGDAPFVHSEAVFKLNGVTDDNITAFTTNIENNPALELYGSAQTRQEIPATKRVVTGSFTRMYESTTERNASMNNLPRTFQVTFTRGNRSFDIDVGKLRYDNRSAPLQGQSEYISETLNWTGYVDDTANEKDIEITVDTTG
jgi:hypothetical protein